MTRIIKSSWKWDEENNPIGINLGDDISDLIAKKLIKKTKNDEYQGINEWPWKIGLKNSKVISISFREFFFDLIRDDLWNLEYDEFVSALNSKLTKLNEIPAGDSLYVIFRGSFVAIAMLIRK